MAFADRWVCVICVVFHAVVRFARTLYPLRRRCNPLQLRDYQQQAISDIRQAFNAGNRSALLAAPTGMGKTVIFSEITRLATQRGHTVLILVHRRELIDQASDKLSRIGVDHGIICSGYKPKPSKVQVASVQTLARRLKLQPFKPRLIIIDEAHHAVPGNTYGKVLNYWPDALWLGVTATPCRLDGRGMGQMFQTLIRGPSVQDLTARGHLSTARFFAPPITADLSKLHSRAGDFIQSEASEALNRATITGDVITHYQRHADGLPAVAFCCDTKHAEDVAASFRSAGITAQTLLGSTKACHRSALVQEFARGKLQVLVTVDVVSEGFDCPAVACAILLRPTKSEALYLQQVGRVLRPSVNKSHAVVLDHVRNISRHGFPDDERDWTLNDREKRGSKGGPPAPAVRMCPDCFAAFKPAPVCPECGHQFQADRTIEQADGELVELQRRNQRRQVGKARTLDQLLAVAKERGYKPGWAYRLHRARVDKG